MSKQEKDQGKEEKKSNNQNQNTKKEETKEKMTYKPMKKGDYSIHILVEEVKNLISKNEEIPYPIIKLSVNKESKRSKDINCQTDTYFYGEHFYFDSLSMNAATLDNAKITVEVYDKKFSDRKDYIGIYEMDFAYVYNSPDHALKNYWVALANPESDDFSKIRGYLRFSVSVLHTDDPRVELNASSGSGKEGVIALPPQIKATYYQFNLQFFKAKGIPDMDSILSVNHNKKECDCYIKVSYMGVTLKTSVVEMKDNIIVWNEQISLPVSYPIVSQKICCEVWDHDVSDPDDIIGSFELNVNEILDGVYSKFRYVNIYGAPLKCTGTFTNKMNENSELGSYWKGKILMRADSNKCDYPKNQLNTIDKNSPILAELGKLREKTLWNFQIFTERALYLPYEIEDYMIKFVIEEQSAELPVKTSQQGMINYNITRNLSIYALSDDINDLGDMFVYLIKGKKDEEKNRICFQRLDAKYFVNNSEFFIMKFYPDPAIGDVEKVSKSGLLSLKVKLSCPSSKEAIEIIPDIVSDVKKTVINNVIPPKKEESDSSDDDLDSLVKKKEKKTTQLKEISTQLDKQTENLGSGLNKGKNMTIVVNIHQTRDIIPGDDTGVSDLYVKVKFHDKEKQTSVKYKTINGIWNETLVFSGLQFDINDEKTWPVAFLEVWDKDDFSKDDDLGFTYIWMTDCKYKVNSVDPIIPSWVNLYLPLSNKKQGKVLLSFYLIEESRSDLINKIKSLDISPPNELYSFELNVLGLRGLQPRGIIPVKKPYIMFDLNSIAVIKKEDLLKKKTKEEIEQIKKDEKEAGNSSSQKENIKTEPKQSGPDPTINTIIAFDNYLPKQDIFTPNMLCFVYDYILAGLGNNLLGAFEIDISKMVKDTNSEMDKDMNLIKKKVSNKFFGNKVVMNALNTITENENMSNEEKKLKQQQIISNNTSNGDKKLVNDPMGEGDREMNNEINHDQVELSVVNDKKLDEIKLEKNLSTFKGITQKNEDESGDSIIILPKFKAYSLPTPPPRETKAEDKKNKKDDKSNEKTEEEKQALKEKRKAVYVIEDESKIPDNNKYIELGYQKVSTLKEGESIEDAAAMKADPYKKHYRRIYQLPLEDPSTGLGLQCPFIKIPIRVGAYEDKTDKNQLFKALSNHKNKVLKDFNKNNKDKQQSLSIKSASDEIVLQDAGYFKGLIRICEKNRMKSFKDFLANADRKLNNCNHLNKYEELSKKLLAPQEVLVRLYLLDLTKLAEKDTLSASDPYVKIILGDTIIDEQKYHKDDLLDCSIRKVYDLSTYLPGSSLLKIQVWDYDPLFSDELIGETIIDIEDRFYDYKWQEIKDKPVEVRPLYHPDFHQPQGYASMWLEIVDKSDKNSIQKYDISSNPDAKAELRVIIWETRDIPKMDVEDTSDMYLSCFVEADQKQSTDVHFRCQTGIGSFNWRMLFPLTLPRTNLSNYLNVQVYDKDYFSVDDYTCNSTMNLEDFLKRIYQLDTPLKFSEDYYNTLSLEEKQKMFGTTDKEFLPEWCKDDDHNKDNKFWLSMKRPNKDGVTTEKTGAVLISIEAMPQWKADICKVGIGRDEPNVNPYLPPPFGRFEWSLNPFKMFNQCVGPAMRKKVCQLICVVFCIIWCLFLVPYVILYLCGEVVNPFNWRDINDN